MGNVPFKVWSTKVTYMYLDEPTKLSLRLSWHLHRLARPDINFFCFFDPFLPQVLSASKFPVRMIVATILAFKQTWCSQFCNRFACSGCWPGGPSLVSIVFAIWLMKHSNTLYHISSEISPCGSNAANRILVTLMNFLHYCQPTPTYTHMEEDV